MGRRGPRRRKPVDRNTVRESPFQLIESDDFPIGGRLRHFVDFWRRITTSKKIIQTVLGAPMPFISEPRQEVLPEPYHLSSADQELIRKEVRWMLDQKIVSVVEAKAGQVISPFFLATNKDKSKRPILNVREINRNNLPRLHFKMETLAKVLPLIKKNDWFTSWDVRKGFFQYRNPSELSPLLLFRVRRNQIPIQLPRDGSVDRSTLLFKTDGGSGSTCKILGYPDFLLPG